MIVGTNGTIKDGEINPLTQDKITYSKSESTAKEIEVWLIKFAK